MEDWSTVLSCLICLVPALIGGVGGWVLKSRALVLGWPWAVLPFGTRLKKFWESINE